MPVQLDILEFSDFLVERVQPKSRSDFALPGTRKDTLGIAPRSISMAAGCCCCCCCCNCNSGGGAVQKLSSVSPIELGFTSTMVTIHSGQHERKSHLRAGDFELAATPRQESFRNQSSASFDSKLHYATSIEGVEASEFITHTWYGPERTIRFGGEVSGEDPSSISTITLDATTSGLWKVVSRDISGAIISFVVFELDGNTAKLVDAEFSPINADFAEVSAGVDAGSVDTFSPRQGRVFFRTKFDKELAEGQIRHAWYRKNELHKLEDAKVRGEEFVSFFDIPDEYLGGWYVVATDESGRHITTSSFSARPA